MVGQSGAGSDEARPYQQYERQRCLSGSDVREGRFRESDSAVRSEPGPGAKRRRRSYRHRCRILTKKAAGGVSPAAQVREVTPLRVATLTVVYMLWLLQSLLLTICVFSPIAQLHPHRTERRRTSPLRRISRSYVRAHSRRRTA